MKQLLVVIIGCMPLGWLTASNVLRWRAPVDSAVSAAERPKLDLPAIRERAVKAERAAADDLPFVHSLVALEPFTDAPKVIDPATVEARFKPVAVAWQDFTKSQTAVVGASELYRSKMAASDEVKKLTRYLEGRPVSGLRDGNSIEQWCKDRIDLLNRTELTASALKQIRQFFASNQYAEVVKRIEALPEDGVTPADKADVARILAKSKFGLHWQGAGESGLLTPLKARTRVAKLSELLKKSPLPVDEDDQAIITRFEQEKADRLLKLRVDDLFDAPPKKLFDLVEDSVRILDDDPESQPRLQSGLKGWIATRLQTKLPPEYHPNMKEVWYKGAEKYRRGAFELSAVSTEPMYKYWNEPTKANKSHDLAIYLRELKGAPEDMLDRRLCRQYNEILAGLLKELGSQTAWEGFAKSCEEMQKQLVDYYAKIPSKPNNTVSFQAEGQLAREVIDQWSKVARILK